MLNLTFIEPAREDVRSAKKWYKNQSPGLEKRLAESIKLTLQFIQHHPFAFSIRYKDVRIANIKIFPYAIHYLVQQSSNRIVIMAIVHIKRSPEATQSRTSESD